MAELDFRQKPSKAYNLSPFLGRVCLAFFACARDDRFLVFFVGKYFPYEILSSILGLKIRLKFAIMHSKFNNFSIVLSHKSLFVHSFKLTFYRRLK